MSVRHNKTFQIQIFSSQRRQSSRHKNVSLTFFLLIKTHSLLGFKWISLNLCCFFSRECDCKDWRKSTFVCILLTGQQRSLQHLLLWQWWSDPVRWWMYWPPDKSFNQTPHHGAAQVSKTNSSWREWVCVNTHQLSSVLCVFVWLLSNPGTGVCNQSWVTVSRLSTNGDQRSAFFRRRKMESAWWRCLCLVLLWACVGVCVCVCVGRTKVARTPPHLYGNHAMALQCPLLVESDEAAHTIILSAFRTHLKQIKNS